MILESFLKCGREFRLPMPGQEKKKKRLDDGNHLTSDDLWWSWTGSNGRPLECIQALSSWASYAPLFQQFLTWSREDCQNNWCRRSESNQTMGWKPAGFWVNTTSSGRFPSFLNTYKSNYLEKSSWNGLVILVLSVIDGYTLVTHIY